MPNQPKPTGRNWSPMLRPSLLQRGSRWWSLGYINLIRAGPSALSGHFRMSKFITPRTAWVILLVLRWAWIALKWFVMIYLAFLLGPLLVFAAFALFASR